MTHTPWVQSRETPSRVDTPDGSININWRSNSDPSVEQNAEETARRIVAMHRALAGIPTPELEAGIVGEMVEALAGMAGLITLLEARDDLPTSLREVLRGQHRITDARALLARLGRET